jgi:hypothetical protein
MSLYYEAAAILANVDKVGGSLKSRIFSKKDLKSTPGQLFALIAESSKWSVVLKDVIEKTKLLAEERKASLPRDTLLVLQLTCFSSLPSSLSSLRTTYFSLRKASLRQPRMCSSSPSPDTRLVSAPN